MARRFDAHLRTGFLVAVCMAASLLVAPASAQAQRAFPATALRGAVVIGEAPEISLNGRPARLSPGARIRDASNLVVVPSGLIGSRFLVHYTLDTLGLVREVWILTPQEAAKRPWPTTPAEAERLVFDPAAQSWSRP